MMISIVLFLLLSFSHITEQSPITNPFKPNGDINDVIPDYFDTKKFRPFHNSTPIIRENVPIVRYDTDDPSCNIEFRLHWSTTVGSSVYAPSVLFPVGSDGKKKIFLSTYYQYVEVLGFDGYKPWGFPIAFEDSSFQGSPMIYDIDGDGTNDIGVVDKDANLHWIRLGEFGQYLDDYHMQVPKLKVRKDWAVGLDPKFVDSYVQLSMFDHKNYDQYTFELKSGASSVGTKEEDSTKLKMKAKPDDLGLGNGAVSQQLSIKFQRPDLVDGLKSKFQDFQSSNPVNRPGGRKLTSIIEEENNNNNSTFEKSDEKIENLSKDASTEMPLHGDDEHIFHGDFHNRGGEEETDPDVYLGDDFIGHTRRYGGISEGGEEGEVPEGGSFDDGYRYGKYSYMGGMQNDSDFVYVDPHVLGSPSLVDINGDGHMEVVMAVSYYFDSAKYSGKDLDYDPSHFIGGGMACWDLESQEWTWMVHLDLTTDQTKFKALIYGTPTVADLDGNGRQEILIGTSLGLLYLLDGETGFVRRFFPMQFHEIQAQIAVADLRGGSDLEIIVADMGGNLVLVDLQGEVLWDIQLSGTLPHTPTVGDVNGDGLLDIIIVAVSETDCHLWAVTGATGIPLEGYPIALPKGGMASSSAILVDLHDHSLEKVPSDDPTLPPWMYNTPGHEDKTITNLQKESIPSNKGLHILVPSFDGHLYVIDGKKGCAERVDIGEHIYSVPLVDDVNGDGLLDVVVGTMNGQVMLLETNVRYHSLNTWSSFPKHRMNGFTHGQLGISVPEMEKRSLQFADVKGGQSLPVTFDIWDTRVGDGRSYTVSFTAGTNRLTPLYSQKFEEPGRYTVLIPVTPPVSMILVLSMVTEHGQYFEDVIPVSISTRFYVWIKYLLFTPVAILCIPLLFMR